LHHLLSSINDNANAAVTIKTKLFFLLSSFNTRSPCVFFPKARLQNIHRCGTSSSYEYFHIPFHRRARKEVLGMLEALIQQ
jgi:hypothetical protein